MSSVVLESVSRTYDSVVAVRDVSLSAERGEFLTFLGPSGCGKTTTLRMIAGLERDPGGRISIGDSVVSDADRDWFIPPEKRQLGMVFQSYAIWPHMTVFDNVAYPLRIRRLEQPEMDKRVMAALQLVEMEAFAKRPAPMLSGGQQQRVAIARALVAEPNVLLLDEPLSNLDARLRTQMGDEFRSLQRRLGITTLYVTHDQDEAMALSDRVVVMHGGRVLQIGSPESVYRRPATRTVATFLGTPNVLPAEVTACRQGGSAEFELDISVKGAHGRCLSASPRDQGEKIQVMIRPEDLRLVETEAPSTADLVISGTIEDVTFRGPSRTLRMRVADEILTLQLPSTNTLKVGEAIRVYVPHGEAWALAEDAN